MLFEGSFRGDFDGRGGGYGGQLNFPILFDTGASSNFVNPTLLQKLGISYAPSSSTLRLADDSSAPILGKVRLRFKLQSFTSVVSCYVTDLCDEFDVILGNKFMVSHCAVLDYSAYTVSLQRHGKRCTLIPRSILTNEGQLPDKVPEPEVRKSSSKSLPSKDRAARRANRADEHAKYTDRLNGLDPKLVLSCAQANKSIQQGCRSFLVLVTQADIDKLKATLASATVSNAGSGPTAAASNSPVNAPDLDPEQADLLQHVDALKQQYSDVFAEPSGLPPDRGVEHVIPLLPDSQPSFQRMYRLAPSELQEVQRQVIDLLSKQLIEPSTSPFGAPILFGAQYFSCLDAAELHQNCASTSFCLNLPKCGWAQTELPYLGHVIGKDGVKPDPKKVQSVADWPTPTCLREVLQFLGLINFFIKFIQGYANLTKPLTDLSKKDTKFDWTFCCDSAFKALKRALTTAPVLAFPDTDKPFELVCDASGIGLGAVLLQEGRPLAYNSRKMTAAECNYIVTEQELLATVEALRVFRCYLLSGKQFNLVTDNQPNTFLQTQPLLSRRQARWSEYLQRFNFKWVHIPGRLNVADPLSRNPNFKHLNALLAVSTRGSTGKRSVQELHI